MAEDHAQICLETSLITFLEAHILGDEEDVSNIGIIGVVAQEVWAGEPSELKHEAEQARLKEERRKEDERKELEKHTDNCFSVTLFCLHEGFDARGVDFLDAAFQLYGDREYCLLTVPHTAEESQLLTHFTPIRARPNNNFAQVLYVLHRDALRARLKLQWCRDENMSELSDVLSGMANAGAILDILEDCVTQYAHTEEAAKKSGYVRFTMCYCVWFEMARPPTQRVNLPSEPPKIINEYPNNPINL
jgi:hypothetical protein